MSGKYLLGLDEGTTAVKAALFDEQLQPVAEARRGKTSRHPRQGWVEQDANEVLAAVVESIGEVLAAAPGEVVACGLDHQGESVVAWDSETGEPLSPVVVWQDKRSQEVLDEMGGQEEAIREASGLPFDPYFSAAKLAWLLRRHESVRRAREEARLRMGTVDSFLCDRLGGGFATDPSTASRTQLQRIDAAGWDADLCERFEVPIEVLPEIRETVGELGTLSHPDWPAVVPLRAQTVDQQAALAGAGAVIPGRVKATYGTGVFVLAHVGEEVPEPAGGLLPTIAWQIDGRMEYALDGGVFAAGSMLEWMCSSLGLAEDPPALSQLARQADGPGDARVLPALAGLGAPWWRPGAQAVLAGLDGGTTRAMVALAALEGIVWRVADIVSAIRESVSVEGLRVDGGLTNEPLMLQLQADAIGVPVEAAGADATVLGSAALAA
ncbi:MAG: FGGY family carbohydrate kinase, partial [Actinomycetota bacterium]|nr:FGGY family carbohydrate kinase [Actinomycetota bacterium]